MSEFLIHRLGHHGDGVADGPIYAPQTLPGELVTGQVNDARLRDVRIVRPSADRVAAPCSHFKSCGGCQLQHASDAFLESWKSVIISEALAAQGVQTTMRPIAVSPVRSRRRATFSARRTKKGATAGFHAKASDVIVEIASCHLLVPSLLDALPLARALAVAASSRKGALGVSVTQSIAGLDVHVDGGKPIEGQLRVTLAAVAEQFDVARLVCGDEVIVTRRSPVQEFEGIQVVPPPRAFLQATKDAERVLQADVAEILAGSMRVIDLFAGCGTFALPLSRTSTVHAVEGSDAMMRALDQGWRMADRLKAVTTETRDLFRQPVIAEDLARFDAAVIDPPRAGAEAQCEELAAARIPAIAYVSCNPITFARDARKLVRAGYELQWVRPVDQFRWSPHTELTAAFRITST
ncbi:MAG: class I SAM-dependent RNA methyltransferase [Pseudomonadota bacterium]